MATINGKLLKKGDIITFHSDGIDQYGKVLSCLDDKERFFIEPTTEHGFHGKSIEGKKSHLVNTWDCWFSDFTLPISKDEQPSDWKQARDQTDYIPDWM